MAKNHGYHVWAYFKAHNPLLPSPAEWQSAIRWVESTETPPEHALKAAMEEVERHFIHQLEGYDLSSFRSFKLLLAFEPLPADEHHIELAFDFDSKQARSIEYLDHLFRRHRDHLLDDMARLVRGRLNQRLLSLASDDADDEDEDIPTRRRPRAARPRRA